MGQFPAKSPPRALKATGECHRAFDAGPATEAGRAFLWTPPELQWEDFLMTEKWQDEKWAEDIWYRGKVTRRSLVGWGGGAIGAMMLVPPLCRAACGAEKPFKIGSEQPLSGPGAAGGKTAVVGLQMAADRINNSGGINGRPIELVIVDDESSPAVARQKTSKMVQESNIDAHVGGFLSNICLACIAVWHEAKIGNMLNSSLDTTLTTTKCNRVSFRVHDYAPAQAVAFAPYLVNYVGK